MPKHQERKTVPYNKDQMFNLVSDIDSYNEFLPWCNGSKIISREGHHDRDVIIADLEIGYDQFIYTYRSEVHLFHDKTKIHVKNLDGPFHYLDNNWNFTEVDQNNCEIVFDIDFELNNSLFDILMKKFFDLAFQKMVEAFLNRAEEIY